MTATIVPSAADVLACARDTLDRIVLPGLPTQAQRSAATTISHLLRYVERRIEIEGQMLFDEAARLRPLLSDIAGHFAAPPATPASTALCSAIVQTLAARRPPEIYPSIALLSAEIAAMRQHVSDALSQLHQAGTADPDSARLHVSLRAYLSWQLAQEATIVEPSFVRQGPRR